MIREKSNNLIRVAYLGSSNVLNPRVSSNQDTWVQRTHLNLQSYYPDMQFDYVNARLTGYSTASVALAFKHYVSDLKPDIVVLKVYEMICDTAYLARSSGVYGGVHFKPSTLCKMFPKTFLAKKNFIVMKRFLLIDRNKGKLNLKPEGVGADYYKELSYLIRACLKTAKLVIFV